MLYKMAVYVAMCCHLTVFDKDVDYTSMESLEKRCKDDVAHAHGEVPFYEIFRFQKGDGSAW